MTSRRPVGVITRGTTNPNRLRRCDRWLVATQAHRLRGAARSPVVVDLGYGASPVTVLELARRLQPVRPDVEVVGIEISPNGSPRENRWRARELASGSAGSRCRSTGVTRS
ncbi:hypothetical protein GCM10025872_31380 [Barrientosiimonas endolithica]|uniref:Class I SAM-dependent methyltransferase n=1 Tax=Barrientosiimonas endolithica TaxID=1535208 RepID=A0ABM8HEW4_9MICO|nr:hypothetical protein GCM10025872_31380 [Barrientosiimonas endolithica]